MAGNCKLWFSLISSSLGVLFGLSACIVFGGVYHNLDAGAWGFISAVFAAITFHIHYLHFCKKLESWHSVETLQSVKFLGLATLMAGLAGAFWYIFITFYRHIPMVPISNSSVIACVWAFMTAKWGLLLLTSAHHYSNHVCRENVPLLM